MNASTRNTSQLRKALVALTAVVLLGAAGPVYSAAAGSAEQRLACQNLPSCGG